MDRPAPRNKRAQSYGIQRLLRDYKEVMQNPLPTITARPLEDNLFEWHCNMMAPMTSKFAGAIFHLILYIPENYPTMPPQVRLMTEIPHGNVFREGQFASKKIVGKHKREAYYVCCNMLVSEYCGYGGQKTHKYQGWSPAYSIQSILIQLQAFLTDTRSWGSVSNAKMTANRYHCERCCHKGVHRPWPKLNSPLTSYCPLAFQESRSRSPESVWGRTRSYNPWGARTATWADLGGVPAPIALAGVTTLEGWLAATNGGRTNPIRARQAAAAIEAPSEATQTTASELDEETSSGSNVEITPLPVVPVQFRPAYDTEEFKAVEKSWFIAFSDQVTQQICLFLNRTEQERIAQTCKYLRRVVKEQMSFHFAKQDLRCFFTKANFTEETLGLGVNIEMYSSGGLKEIIPTLDLLSYKAFSQYGRNHSAINEQFTHFLPVYLSKGHGATAMKLARKQFQAMVGSTKNAESILKILPCLMNSMVVKTMQGDLHESIAALEGYILFYHMLLAFAEESPMLRKIVDRRVAKFKKSEWGRSKDNVPNLGEFIACLAISNKYSWEDVCRAYVAESFDRQPKWFDNLRRLEGGMNPDHRIRKTAPNTLVSNRLCLFHVAFFRLFRKDGRDATAAKHLLDRLYGRPTAEMVESLQRNVKRIRAIKASNLYKTFYAGVGLPVPSTKELGQKLADAVSNSRRRGYHGDQTRLYRRMAREQGQLNERSAQVAPIKIKSSLPAGENSWKSNRLATKLRARKAVPVKPRGAPRVAPRSAPASRVGQQQPARRFVQPQPARRFVQPAQRFVQPQPARRFVQPQPARRFVQPQPARRFVQPQPAQRFVQPQPATQSRYIPGQGLVFC